MSNTKTVVVAFILCVVCSILVSVTAIGLRPIQLKNAELDVKKNILMAAGLYEEGIEIESAFESIETLIINFETGEKVDSIAPSEYDMAKAVKNPKYSVKIPSKEDIGGLSSRPKYAKVYLTRESDGTVKNIILPIQSKGLWSTMNGFMSLEGDARTVANFSYYQQGETPGLGAEVNNPKWKATWQGKKIYNDDMVPAIDVTKNNSGSAYEIDALSGATITGDGVQSSINYWFGDHGFAKFLENVRLGSI
jgi:Na+-transporting NADH:ubiquinone oxidoreductase subunit C